MRKTSFATYYEIIREGLVSEKQEKVMRALKKLREATDREISRYLHYGDPNKVRPRRYELVKLGIVEEAGQRLCSVTRRKAYTWRIKIKLR